MGKMGGFQRPFSIPLRGRDRDASGGIIKRSGEMVGGEFENFG